MIVIFSTVLFDNSRPYSSMSACAHSGVPSMLIFLPFQSRSCPKDRSIHSSEDRCLLQAKLHASCLRPLLWMMTLHSEIAG